MLLYCLPYCDVVNQLPKKEREKGTSLRSLKDKGKKPPLPPTPMRGEKKTVPMSPAYCRRVGRNAVDIIEKARLWEGLSDKVEILQKDIQAPTSPTHKRA